MEKSRLIGLKRQARKAGWYKDWTPADEDALLRGCWFDEASGYDPVDFIETFCKLSQGDVAGKTVKLLDWQKEDFIIPLFGWMREDGTRRYRRTYLTVAKKNHKSTIASELGLYLLLGDGEPGAEIYCAATLQEQANIIWNECANMAEASPVLESKLNIDRRTHSISLGNTAWIKSLARDPKGKASEGKKTFGLILEELHVWSDREFLSSLIWGSTGRRQPLTIMITTRGDDEESICGEYDAQAQKILSGEIFTYDFLPVIYASDPDDDIDDPETWKKANPCLGITIKEEDFRNDLEDAKVKGPASLAAFRRYRLNQWSGADKPYFNIERWKELAPAEPPTEEELKKAMAFGGLDMSHREDICAYAKVFIWKDRLPYIKMHFWVPEERVKERLQLGLQNYRIWQDEGELEAVPGDVIDQDFIHTKIREDCMQYRMRELAFDRWGAERLANDLSIGGLEVVAFGQGFASMSVPTKLLRDTITERQISHDGNRCMNWQMKNAVSVEDPSGNVKIIKSRKTVSGTKRFKVDGTIALIMAFDRATRNLEANIFEDAEMVDWLKSLTKPRSK